MKIEATESLCTGCRLCQLACSVYQFNENNPKKSGIVISSRLLETGHYRILVCDQCGECAEVCPTGAMKLVDGAYRIDEQECSGCLVCVAACPQQALSVPLSVGEVPVKCIACGECAEVCATGALALKQ